jgi:triacylglycerol lipase
MFPPTPLVPPVLLLHGIGDTSAVCARLRRYLANHGREVHTLDLTPSDGASGLEALAGQVLSYVEQKFPSDQPVDLVGFSMGGIVARYYLQRLGGLARVRRFVTIASPHRGTWMAYFRRTTGARQMRPRSALLRDLDHEPGTLAGLDFTSIWSPFDLTILPATSSVIPEARCLRVAVWAHAWMIRDPRVFALVEQALARHTA